MGTTAVVRGHASARECPVHGCDRLRLVVLDADQDPLGPQHVGDDRHALQHPSRPLAHQPVVAGDVGLAFCPVDDQGLGMPIRSRVELDAGGEGGAAETHHPRPAHPLAQGLRVRGQIVLDGLGKVRPGVLPVGVDDHAGRRQTGGVGDRTRLDGDDGTRGWGMDRGAHITLGLPDHLALAHPLADAHAGPRQGADVLRQGDHQPPGDRRLLDLVAVGEGLLVGYMDAPMETPDALPRLEDRCRMGHGGSGARCAASGLRVRLRRPCARPGMASANGRCRSPRAPSRYSPPGRAADRARSRCTPRR